MPKSGTISVKSYIEDDMACIDVKDTGCGIAADQLQKIWDPFQSKHVTKGRGLGLSIVYRIVREHDGQTSVNSKLNKNGIF